MYKYDGLKVNYITLVVSVNPHPVKNDSFSSIKKRNELKRNFLACFIGFCGHKKRANDQERTFFRIERGKKDAILNSFCWIWRIEGADVTQFFHIAVVSPKVIVGETSLFVFFFCLFHPSVVFRIFSYFLTVFLGCQSMRL